MKIILRVKPTNKESCIRSITDKTLKLITKDKEEMLTFDKVISGSDREPLFDYHKADLEKLLLTSGRLAIMAYGPTNTGKTYSIEGLSQSIVGLITSKKEFTVTMSAVEIYQNKTKDLSNGDNVKFNVEKGVYVGLAETNMENQATALEWTGKMQKNRATSATTANENSSRSHMVFYF